MCSQVPVRVAACGYFLAFLGFITPAQSPAASRPEVTTTIIRVDHSTYAVKNFHEVSDPFRKGLPPEAPHQLSD